MINFFTILLNLTIRLLPTGRAFKVPFDGFQKGVYRALAQSEADWANEATGILDEVLADNDNFTEENAAAWERRLAIRANSGTSLADRKAAILRKYASPGNIPARQHYLYLQRELQAAGFNVYVHENRQPDGFGGYQTIPIEAVIGSQLGTFQLGQQQLGPGLGNLNIIAKYIDEVLDQNFVLPTDLRSTFFIGDATLGDLATVPAIRKDEFRELVLRIKPAQTVGILLVTYN